MNGVGNLRGGAGRPTVGASADERAEEGLLQLGVAGGRMRGPHPWGDEGWVGGHFLGFDP
jgi:hypothetical protein